MIYTLTFNPAIDYVVHVQDLIPGNLNRLKKEQMFFGGKGINVSRMLKELGEESIALGFCAGFTGDAIENGIRAMGIKTDFVKLTRGNSRINVKIKAWEETELNGMGPDISNQDMDMLFEKLDKIAQGDILVMSGSVPKSIGVCAYSDIMKKLSSKGIKFVVDASGELLTNSLLFGPELIKPNKDELEQIFSREINSAGDTIEYAKKLQSLGAKRVLVSMGAEGAVFVNVDGFVYRVKAPAGKPVNSVGAGDSMVAGFLAGQAKNFNIYDTLKLAVAAGSATAFSEDIAKGEEVESLFNLVAPEKIG